MYSFWDFLKVVCHIQPTFRYLTPSKRLSVLTARGLDKIPSLISNQGPMNKQDFSWTLNMNDSSLSASQVTQSPSSLSYSTASCHPRQTVMWISTPNVHLSILTQNSDSITGIKNLLHRSSPATDPILCMRKGQ